MVSAAMSAQPRPSEPGPQAREPVGALIRRRRLAAGMTLQRLAELVGCAKSYLSAIENQRRANPPGQDLLRRIEQVLRFESGTLIRAASWQATPEAVRREVVELHDQQRAARRLAELIRVSGLDDPDRPGRSLDRLYRSGELRRLVERLAGPAGGGAPGQRLEAALPLEVPLINKVAAGYPTEFTDLGYPARVADEYVRCPDLNDPDAFAARVVGDSMEPTYREGDIVVFSPARPVQSGMDCFARLEPDHETTFKRVYFEAGPDGREMIRLQPLNSAYPPRVVPREQVAGLYAAVSVTRTVDPPAAPGGG